MKRIKLLLIALLVGAGMYAQEEIKNNPILTATPLLQVSPESRGSGMGDAGAATSADIYSQYWNPAKYAFIEDQYGVGLSYTPWLRNLGVKDIGLVDVAGYYRFDKLQTVSASLRYFSLGEIDWTDGTGTSRGTISPNEFAIDVAYSRKFTDTWSGAVAFRYIRSDLANGYGEDGQYPGNAFAVDLAAYYNSGDVYSGAYNSRYAFGFNISNVGSKISYTKGADREFIPANLKIGGSYELDFDDYNSLMFTVDLNKLLVPTPPDSAASDYLNEIGSLEGIFKSFGDAPGGFKEEIQEIMVSVGAEYSYNDSFFVRGGYFHENQNKGNRKFFSVGAGFKLSVFALDVSYLVPMTSTSPLANTLRFSLSFGMDGIANMLGN